MQEVLNYLVPDGVDVHQDQTIMPLCEGNVDAQLEIKVSTLTNELLLEIDACINVIESWV